MYAKTSMFMAALLLLLTTSIVPIKVAAQGLVEYALILIMVGVGQNEVAQIHWEPGPGRAKSQGPQVPTGTTQTFTLIVTNSGPSHAENCPPQPSQTFTVPVEVKSGINTLNVSTIGPDLFINGERVDGPPLDSCIAGAKRTLYQIGVPFPPGLANQDEGNPAALRYTLQNVMIKSWSVSGDADGGTRAAGWVGFHNGSFDLYDSSEGN